MYDYIIVGAGQAGLSMAYHLKKSSAKFLILDAEEQIGASWLNRWDSLTLFTPTEFNHLPGMKFPAKAGYYPNKFDVANYFQKYVKHYDFPIQFNTKVQCVEKSYQGFKLSSNRGDFQCNKVIVASGPFHTPFIPPCHKNISSDVKQIHSSEYRNPEQLQVGETMVVGAGDSGFQILKEVAEFDASRQVYFSGTTDLLTIPQEILGKTLWWWFNKLGVLSAHKYSWFGKQIQKRVQPVIGIDINALLQMKNIKSVGHTLDANEHEIVCKKATLTNVKNIIWSTGFKADFTWLKDIPLDKQGYPVNYRGVSAVDGLYFIGLPWMYTRGSATLGGVYKDAEFLFEVLNSEKQLKTINAQLRLAKI